MESMKICKKCSHLMNFNSYFGGYYCTSCGLLEPEISLYRYKRERDFKNQGKIVLQKAGRL